MDSVTLDGCFPKRHGAGANVSYIHEVLNKGCSMIPGLNIFVG
jgi:hypothetical protein